MENIVNIFFIIYCILFYCIKLEETAVLMTQ